MLDKCIDNLKDEIIKETCNLINFPSVSEETSDPNMPFGKNAKDALEYALDLGQKLGFRTKNIDGYCGYIEFGEGEKLVGIIGHLDVVPSGDGWLTPPFEATIKDGNIFEGKFKPENNLRCVKGHYAAHTGGGNTGSIGIAMCGMYGFKNKNCQGAYPITAKQFEAAMEYCAKLAIKYRIPIAPETVMTHYEFGKKHPETTSAGKIDITFIFKTSII